MTIAEARPAIEGWFAQDPEPHLVGLRCSSCGTFVFPPRAFACPNPSCTSSELTHHPLSRTGAVWSFATNHYPPPAPYVAPDPFVPYTVVAVQLDEEGMVVLGQLAGPVEGLHVGDQVELVVEPLYEDDDGPVLVWKWARTFEEMR